jgi:AbrB family looped-hinge helix DNA binding protein
MELAKVKRNYQITIPQSLRKKIKLAVGDYVELDTQDNMIVIKPVKVVREDQAYFHTKEWQKKEAEADKDIERSEVVGPVDNIEDALATLKNAKL